MSSNAVYHLVRIDSDKTHTHGWQGRFYPYGRIDPDTKKSRPYKSKFFADGLWKTPERARKAAQKWLKDIR